MSRRLALQTIFEDILGTRNVYHQPPSEVIMKYPAIVYARRPMHNKHANNDVYNQRQSYSVTVIDPNPDSEIVSKISQLPTCKPEQSYQKNNLNHDVFVIYY